MGRRRNLWGLTAGAAVIVAVGMLVGVRVWAAGPIMPPDPVQVRVVMPAITAYLQSPAYRDRNGEYPAAAYQTGRVRWLCAAEIVYVDPDGSRWRAGMDVACGDYERQGSRVILADGGDMGHEVMVLSGDGGQHQVLTAAQEPGVSPDPAWIDRNFPASAAAEVNRGRGPMASMPDARALLDFGCTAADAAHGSVISAGENGAALGWPCPSTQR